VAPYVFQKARTYKGVECKPGDPCPDLKPKRTLVSMGVLRWIPSDGESWMEPLSKRGDRGIDHSIPPIPKTEVVDVPTFAKAMAQGYTAHAAAEIITKRLAIVHMVADGAGTALEAADLAESMPHSELEGLLTDDEREGVAKGLETVLVPPEVAPEPKPQPDTTFGTHIDDDGHLIKTDSKATEVPEGPVQTDTAEVDPDEAASVGLLIDDPKPTPTPPKKKTRKKRASKKKG